MFEKKKSYETCKTTAQLDFPKHFSLGDGASKCAIKTETYVVTLNAELIGVWKLT